MGGRISTEEVCTMTEVGPGPSQGGGGKTLGVKLSDEVHAQLVLIAGLEQVSLTDLIRQAIDMYLQHKRSDQTLAARAAEAAQEVEREAALRRDALNALFGGNAQTGETAATEAVGTSRRRGKEATS
jgi:predicted transcriptional regulator